MSSLSTQTPLPGSCEYQAKSISDGPFTSTDTITLLSDPAMSPHTGMLFIGEGDRTTETRSAYHFLSAPADKASRHSENTALTNLEQMLYGLEQSPEITGATPLRYMSVRGTAGDQILGPLTTAGSGGTSPSAPIINTIVVDWVLPRELSERQDVDPRPWGMRVEDVYVHCSSDPDTVSKPNTSALQETLAAIVNAVSANAGSSITTAANSGEVWTPACLHILGLEQLGLSAEEQEAVKAEIVDVSATTDFLTVEEMSERGLLPEQQGRREPKVGSVEPRFL